MVRQVVHPDMQGTARASIVHHYLYRKGGEDSRFTTKKQADRIFYKILEVVGAIGTVRRWIAYRTVYLFGCGKW